MIFWQHAPLKSIFHLLSPFLEYPKSDFLSIIVVKGHILFFLKPDFPSWLNLVTIFSVGFTTLVNNYLVSNYLATFNEQIDWHNVVWVLIVLVLEFKNFVLKKSVWMETAWRFDGEKCISLFLSVFKRTIIYFRPHRKDICKNVLRLLQTFSRVCKYALLNAVEKHYFVIFFIISFYF